MVKIDRVLDGHLLAKAKPQLVPASKVKRLVNVLIDYLGVIVFLTFIFFILLLLGQEKLVADRQGMSETLRQAQGILAILLYYLLSEYFLAGKSLGKFLTRTKVVTLDGKAPGWKAVLKRALARFIPFEPLSILWSGHRTWHDQLSGTMVVEDRN